MLFPSTQQDSKNDARTRHRVFVCLFCNNTKVKRAKNKKTRKWQKSRGGGEEVGGGGGGGTTDIGYRGQHDRPEF